MVKTLQKKFIVAAMIVVTILLATLIGAINILNYISVTELQRRMLEMLCETDARPERSAFIRGGKDGRQGRWESGYRTDFPGGEYGIQVQEDKRQDGTGLSDNNNVNGNPSVNEIPPQETGEEPALQQGAEDRERGREKTSPALFGRGFTLDDMMAIRFFAVWFDENGEILTTDVSRIYSVSEEEAAEIAKSLFVPLDGGEKKGGLSGDFRYMLQSRQKSDTRQGSGIQPESDARPVSDVQPDSDARPASDAQPDSGQETRKDPEQDLSAAAGKEAAFFLVAMDTSGDRSDLLAVLGISCLIAAICWLLMLIPVYLLARRAIAPVAMSVERQKQFVTNAGHELKTPVAIIQANTEALELFNGESKWTRNIRSQTERLNGLMQNLLTLSKMDESAMDLKMSSFPAGVLISEVWENFAEPAGARDISFLFQASKDGSDSVLANRESIAQLLSILFDNAVKYTPSGGQIQVSVTRDSGWVRLVQSNTVSADSGDGEGGLPEDPNRLFERFYRADKDRSRKKGGYGIGLSAARAIAEANRGSIRAEKERDRISFVISLRRGNA